MVRYFSFLLFISLISCYKKHSDPEETAINDLYNAVIKNRYAITDSLKYYVKQIEEKALKKPAEYCSMAAIVKGIYFGRISDYPASLEQFRSAAELLKDSKADSLKGRAYNGIGNAYKNMGNYPLAIQNLQLALSYFEKLSYAEGIAGVHSNIGQCYQLKGDNIASLKHLRQGLSVLKGSPPSRAYLNLMHTMANAHLYSGRLDSALLLDELGLSLANEMGALLFRSPFFDNKANVYAKKGLVDSARHYYSQCLVIDSAAGSTKQMADTYINLGRLEADNKNDVAKAYFQQSIALSEKAKYLQGQRDAWNGLSEVYEEEKAFSKALEARRQFSRVNDSMINEATEKKLVELQTTFDISKKEQQLQLQAVQLSRQQLLIWVIIAGSAAFLLLLYQYYRRWQLKRSAEMQQVLLQQKQEAIIQILTAEEKERQRIAIDLHDGIGQTMTAAWLNLQALGKRLSPDKEETVLVEKTTTLVGESCTEIRQVSHNMMPNALQRKGLINAIREFTNQLDEKVISVRLQADDQKLFLDPTTELIVYRVIQECVNNVVKHAQATELDISIVNDLDGLDILVEDNGLGFSYPTQNMGMGIQNIKSRIQYLQGTVEWDNTGSGTVVAIHIPYQHA
jgi:signal transduction histidine kinase